MRKHSLIGMGLGVGLLAASMGAAAQPAAWTFDYSMMFFTPTATGAKYVGFLPTLARGTVASAGVLAVELYQPAGSGANSWAFAVGGALAGTAAAGATVDVGGATAVTVGNAVANSIFKVGLGDTVALTHTFAGTALGASSQVCDVTFTANISANGMLAITSARALPQSWSTYAASGAGGFTFTTGSATSLSTTLATSILSNASASVGTFSYTASGADLLVKFNRCVTAYTNRVSPAGTLVGTGLIRVW